MTGPSSLPPAPPTMPTQPPAPRDGTPARILSAGGALAQMSRPATVTGQVVALAPDGTARIHTDQGDISLQPRNSATPLAVGQSVDIDISAGRPPRQATFRPADASSSTPTSSSASGATSQAASTSSASNAGGDADGNGQSSANAGTATTTSRPPAPLIADTVVAELASDAGASAAGAATAQVAVEAGDLLRLQPVPAGQPLLPPTVLPATDVTMPLMPSVAVTATPAISAQMPGALLSNGVGASGALPKITPPMLTPLPAGPAGAARPGQPGLAPLMTKTPSALTGTLPAASPPLQAGGSMRPFTSAKALDIRVRSLGPPAPRFMPGTAGTRPNPVAGIPAAPRPPAAGAPSLLSGTVVGHVAAPGFAPMPVLSVALPGQPAAQLFAVQVPAANLPVGATISFLPLGDAALPDVADDTPGLATPALQWLSLSVIHDATAAVLPRADLPLAAMLPNPALPGALPAATLLFVAALRAGDLAGWLGEKTLDALRRGGQDDLLSRLGADGEVLSRLDAPAAGNAESWRVLPLPLLWEGEVQRLVLRYRRDRAPADKGKERRAGTRFVFDMAMSRMGAVQLDGLHKPKTQADDDDRLDLIVRTRAGLSAAMQAAMRVRYHEALTACDHRGEMLFQYRPDQWLKFETA